MLAVDFVDRSDRGSLDKVGNIGSPKVAEEFFPVILDFIDLFALEFCAVFGNLGSPIFFFGRTLYRFQRDPHHPGLLSGFFRKLALKSQVRLLLP